MFIVFNKETSNILDHKVKRLEMFCDGCAGQNKNFTVLRLLHYVVHTRRLEYIKLTFPVRGHSYLECDRNMALVNQKYHAELPEHWIDVFENARMKPLPFNVIHVDQSLLRKWTEYLAPLFVKKCPFPTRPVKEIIFSSDNSRLVQYRSSYNGMWETAVFTPPNAKFLQSMMEQQNLGHDEFVLPERLYEELLPISWEKYTDIQHLKQFCSPSAKAFYESLKHK